ncbi:MAG TPA: DUF3489 domain-containing protein [Bryobacteraceae bacterium]|nr:DUF3489 domain-containing protein [Bryobacteraceae bacterium]
MTTFVIETDNNITAFAAAGETRDLLAAGGKTFTSEKELGALAAEWPTARLVEIWNSFAGIVPFTDLKPVTKFENRQKAVKRIWQAVQRLAPGAEQGATGAPPAAASTKDTTPARKPAKRAKGATKAKTQQKPVVARDGSKKSAVLALMRRRNGASLKELMDATGWQAHSVRGFISGSLGKKMGLAVESIKGNDGERTYRVE